MGNVLYLVHRLPFPPNKGDKVRSYHLLRHLAARHRVFLATFVDDPDDERHVDTVRQWCADVHVSRLHPRAARLRSLRGLAQRKALTLEYYRSQAMQEWVDGIRARHPIDATVVFSSAMGPYACYGPDLVTLVDFVDVDSAKWSEYAKARPWPLSWLYAREGRLLLRYEREVAAKARQAFFVTEGEAALFRRLAPESARLVGSAGNGVDAAFFSPASTVASPFAAADGSEASVPLVFTGAMDYWPNVDAVVWFANEIFPRLRQQWPGLQFHIVGRSPDPAVTALASESIHVTGTVPDVRPYLAHARVVVAPLRLARGIQNKILEAMAMARPVVAAATCCEAVDAADGQELCAASTADDYIDQILDLLRHPEKAERIGAAARENILRNYSWAAHLAQFDRFIPDPS